MKVIIAATLVLCFIFAIADNYYTKIDLQVREELLTSPKISILIHMKEKAIFDKNVLKNMDHSTKGHYMVNKVILCVDK